MTVMKLYTPNIKNLKQISLINIWQAIKQKINYI